MWNQIKCRAEKNPEFLKGFLISLSLMSNDLTSSFVLDEQQTVFYHQGVYIQDKIKNTAFIA